MARLTPDMQKTWDDAAVSIASRGQLQPPDGRYLPPHLWEAFRVKLQSHYRRATGEPDAILTISSVSSDDARRALPGGSEAQTMPLVERLRADVDDLLWVNWPSADGGRFKRMTLTGDGLKRVADHAAEAAARIEALEAENARLEKERDDLLADHRLFAHHRKKQGDHDTQLIEAATARAEAAEAQLAIRPVEAVAWQWRSRIKGGAWDAWEMGRFGQPVPPSMEIEERPLYAEPPPELLAPSGRG